MTTTIIDEELADIKARLERLEEGKFPGKTINCESLTMHDSEGKCRLLLTVTEDGVPTIGMLSSSGDLSLMIDGSEGQPRVVLYRHNDEDAVNLNVCERGNGSIHVSRSSDNNFIHVGTIPTDDQSSFGLTVFGADDEALWARFNGELPTIGVSSPCGEAVSMLGNETAAGILWTDKSGDITRVLLDDEE